MFVAGNLLLLTALIGIHTAGGSPGEPGGGDPGCKAVREILTSEDMFVVSVNGQGAINAGVSIGMRLAEVAVELQAEVTAESRGTYKIICYENEGILCLN